MQNLAIINLRSITKGRILGLSKANLMAIFKNKKKSEVFRSYFIQHGMLGDQRKNEQLKQI